MKIFNNVLSNETIVNIMEERKQFSGMQRWSNSSSIWSDDLKDGITGECFVTYTSDTAHNVIYEEIKHIIPNKFDKIVMQHYVWNKNSGISMHVDGNYRFALTIYLNREWNPNQGGLFVWQENSGEYKIHVPKFNSAILNDSGKLHMVTPVSPLSTENRETIQIWGI